MDSIPTKEDWGDYWKDFDRKSAFNSFYGKSNSEMQALYFTHGNELMTEIRFMPPKPFQYYILGLKDFILADVFPEHEASDFTSYFLAMVELVVKTEPKMIEPVIHSLMPAIEYVANNQSKYQAPIDIYGDYLDKLSSIRSALNISV